MSETTKCATCGHDELNHRPFGENPSRRDLCDVPNCECRVFYAPAPAPTPPDAVREALVRVIQHSVFTHAFANLAIALGITRGTTPSELADALLSRAPVGGTAAECAGCGAPKVNAIIAIIERRAACCPDCWLGVDDRNAIRAALGFAGVEGRGGRIAAPVPPAPEGEREMDKDEAASIILAHQLIADDGDASRHEVVWLARAYLALRAAPSGVTEAVKALPRNNGLDPDPEGAFVYLDDVLAALEARRVG